MINVLKHMDGYFLTLLQNRQKYRPKKMWCHNLFECLWENWKESRFIEINKGMYKKKHEPE